MTTSRKKLHLQWHRKLAAHWKVNPIQHCELKFDGCFGTYGLAPAHSMRRRFIDSYEKYAECCAACQSCHRRLDYEMSPEECRETVLAVIARRE